MKRLYVHFKAMLSIKLLIYKRQGCTLLLSVQLNLTIL